MSSHSGMKSSEKRDYVRWPSDEIEINQRKLNDEHDQSKCESNFLENPFTYRSKQIYGCIIKGYENNSEMVGPKNECCTEVKLTSVNDINSIMWKQMPEFKGKEVTGRYIKTGGLDDTYYSHESGSFFLCTNGHRQWQVT